MILFSQPSRPVLGVLTVPVGQRVAFVDADWYDAAQAPNACRGFAVKVRTGAVRLGGAEASAANEGQTYEAGQGFADETAANVADWYAYNPGESAATVEILCRTGGAS